MCLFSGRHRVSHKLTTAQNHLCWNVWLQVALDPSHSLTNSTKSSATSSRRQTKNSPAAQLACWVERQTIGRRTRKLPQHLHILQFDAFILCISQQLLGDLLFFLCHQSTTCTAQASQSTESAAPNYDGRRISQCCTAKALVNILQSLAFPLTAEAPNWQGAKDTLFMCQNGGTLEKIPKEPILCHTSTTPIGSIKPHPIQKPLHLHWPKLKAEADILQGIHSCSKEPGNAWTKCPRPQRHPGKEGSGQPKMGEGKMKTYSFGGDLSWTSEPNKITRSARTQNISNIKQFIIPLGWGKSLGLQRKSPDA